MLPLRHVMSRGIHSCKISDTARVAERIMREWQVRRLPVVDGHGRLVGLLPLNDFACFLAVRGVLRAR